VPLDALMACTPEMILLNPEVSVWEVPVNILVGPLVGPSTVIGLLALVLGTLWPAGAEALWTLAAGGAHLVLLIARTADALPGSRVAVPEGAPGARLAVGVLLAVALAVAAARPSPVPGGAGAPPPADAVGGGGAAGGGAHPGSGAAPPRPRRSAVDGGDVRRRPGRCPPPAPGDGHGSGGHRADRHGTGPGGAAAVPGPA